MEQRDSKLYELPMHANELYGMSVLLRDQVTPQCQKTQISKRCFGVWILNLCIFFCILVSAPWKHPEIRAGIFCCDLCATWLQALYHYSPPKLLILKTTLTMAKSCHQSFSYLQYTVQLQDKTEPTIVYPNDLLHFSIFEGFLEIIFEVLGYFIFLRNFELYWILKEHNLEKKNLIGVHTWRKFVVECNILLKFMAGAFCRRKVFINVSR